MKKLFSWEIIKQSIQSSWVWWLIIMIVTSLNLFAVPVGAETPEDQARVLQVFANMAIGGNGVIFMVIFAVMFANLFITHEVDRGTLAITLNTPTTRKQVLFSKAMVFVLLLITYCVAVGVMGTISALAFGIGDYFNFSKWWTIIALWCAYAFLAGGIAFAIACWFNKSRYTLAITSLILGAFFLFFMLSQLNDLEFLRYFSVQTLFDMDAVLDGDSVVWQLVAMVVIAIPLYVIGAMKFLKKDLPL